MPEYIEREAVFEKMSDSYFAYEMEWFKENINEIPTADVAPVMHSLWNRTLYDYECCLCGYSSEYKTTYCACCGAKMDLKRR